MMKKQARGKFDYSFGRMRPIRQCNHEMCQRVEDVLVPKFMGWKWNRPIPGLERVSFELRTNFLNSLSKIDEQDRILT